MNPFAFLVVGAGLSLLTFNYFEEEFKAVNADINSEQIRQLKASANKDISKLKNLTESERQKLEIEKKGAQLQLNFMDGLMEFMLRYYNLLTFVFLFMQC